MILLWEYMKFLASILGYALFLSLVICSDVAYSSDDLIADEEKALESSREALRQRFVDNCTKRQNSAKASKRITLAGCEINSKMSFVVKYNLLTKPEPKFERGKDIPLARHYPKLKNALCSNSDDFVDADIESVTVIYLYEGKIIQSNYMDFNDCYLN